ncbi:MAG: thymidine kinase [Deltaproteobacteria bacterium]|nr:thymidine kinase [Deltaproteobacteria bacterium]MBW1872985.1 thymidine kinase [Deltaproteobacteria bacterium]
MQLQPRDTGWIEVICGSMFSGKTEELIRRVRLARIAKQNVIIFKPRLDDRYHERQIVSHSDQRMESFPIVHAREILDRLPKDVNVVGIDEAQFFGPELVEVCESMANRGLRVIVAGLDQDYLGKPFEPIPSLLAVAEFINKNLAICVKCGNPANRSQRIEGSGQRVLVGAHDSYEARCRHCFSPEIEVKKTTKE